MLLFFIFGCPLCESDSQSVTCSVSFSLCVCESEDLLLCLNFRQAKLIKSPFSLNNKGDAEREGHSLTHSHTNMMMIMEVNDDNNGGGVRKREGVDGDNIGTKSYVLPLSLRRAQQGKTQKSRVARLTAQSYRGVSSPFGWPSCV